MPNNAQNLGIYPCISCGLNDILIDRKCNTCNPQNIHIRQHIKELRVKNMLDANQIIYTYDKILEDTSCGRERPDFQIDCGTHYLYVEVDEHQHQSYIQECEHIRMINLVESRGIPVQFIRYNPDSYQPIKGQKIITIEQREQLLLEYIKYGMNHSPILNNAFSNAIYLFYNGYDSTIETLRTIISL